MINKSLHERLWARIDRNGPISVYRPELGNCYIWTGSVMKSGYGSIGFGGRQGGVDSVHVVVWKEVNGDIPKGLTIDHLCFVKRCCNVNHMELTTRSENSRRGNLKRWGETNRDNFVSPLLGRNRSQETRRKMSESHIIANGLKTPEERRIWHSGRKVAG